MNRKELIQNLVQTQGYKATRLKSLSVEQLQELVICDEVTLTKAQHTEYMLELDDARETNMRLNRELAVKQGQIDHLQKQPLTKAGVKSYLDGLSPQELSSLGYVPQVVLESAVAEKEYVEELLEGAIYKISKLEK